MSHSSVLAGLVLPSLAVSDTAAVFSRLQQQTVELSTDLAEFHSARARPLLGPYPCPNFTSNYCKTSWRFFDSSIIVSSDRTPGLETSWPPKPVPMSPRDQDDWRRGWRAILLLLLHTIIITQRLVRFIQWALGRLQGLHSWWVTNRGATTQRSRGQWRQKPLSIVTTNELQIILWKFHFRKITLTAQVYWQQCRWHGASLHWRKCSGRFLWMTTVTVTRRLTRRQRRRRRRIVIVSGRGGRGPGASRPPEPSSRTSPR